jgi:hypothetical protein
MKKPLIIGLAGPARCGKDTVAEYLVTDRNDWIHTSFAAPIRKFVADLLNITLDELEEVKDDYYEPLATSPRIMMQTLGTEWGRQIINPDIWVILAMQRVSGANQLGLNAVLSDVRFNNEADIIREQGGIMIHLYRPDVIPVAKHSSENGVSVHKNDFSIKNDGSLISLYRKIETALHWAHKK